MKKSRDIPEINIEGKEGYAKLLAHNFDSVQECFNLAMPDCVAEYLQQWQDECNKRHDGEQEISLFFGTEDFQIWAGGASGGVKWVLKNDDIQYFFKSPKKTDGKHKTWSVGVRYLSGGLWEHSIKELRARALNNLFVEGFFVLDHNGYENNNICDYSEWQRVSRVDYAFDFYSEDFTHEMKNQHIIDNLVLPSGVKFGVIGTSTTLETLQIGMNRAGLSIQVYDKGKEIVEASGKTWMKKIWERAGIKLPEDERVRHVWRFEVRFGKDFIKDRKTQFFDGFLERMQEFLCEAIFKRRMAVKGCKKHKDEWDLHPLWAEAYKSTEMAGCYAPVGRVQMLTAEELHKMLEKQMLGTVRSMEALKHGDYQEDRVKNSMEKSIGKITADKNHRRKFDKALERYKYIDEVR